MNSTTVAPTPAALVPCPPPMFPDPRTVGVSVVFVLAMSAIYSAVNGLVICGWNWDIVVARFRARKWVWISLFGFAWATWIFTIITGMQAWKYMSTGENKDILRSYNFFGILFVFTGTSQLFLLFSQLNVMYKSYEEVKLTSLFSSFEFKLYLVYSFGAIVIYLIMYGIDQNPDVNKKLAGNYINTYFQVIEDAILGGLYVRLFYKMKSIHECSTRVAAFRRNVMHVSLMIATATITQSIISFLLIVANHTMKLEWMIYQLWIFMGTMMMCYYTNFFAVLQILFQRDPLESNQFIANTSDYSASSFSASSNEFSSRGSNKIHVSG